MLALFPSHPSLILFAFVLRGWAAYAFLKYSSTLWLVLDWRCQRQRNQLMMFEQIQSCQHCARCNGEYRKAHTQVARHQLRDTKYFFSTAIFWAPTWANLTQVLQVPSSYQGKIHLRGFRGRTLSFKSVGLLFLSTTTSCLFVLPCESVFA
jgi:hypothetical protein